MTRTIRALDGYLRGAWSARAAGRVGAPAGASGAVGPEPGRAPVHQDPASRAEQVRQLQATAARIGLRPAGAGDVEPPSDALAACEIGLLVGLSRPCDPIDVLADATDAAMATIDEGADQRALACAVAAAVSAGIDDGTWPQRLALAATAADVGAERGNYRPGPSLSARLTWACALAERSSGQPVDVLALLVGNSALPQEGGAAAFAIAATHRDVEAAHRAALALGGQADLIAGLAGALAGAGSSHTSPTDPTSQAGPQAGPNASSETLESPELHQVAAALAAHRTPSPSNAAPGADR